MILNIILIFKEGIISNNWLGNSITFFRESLEQYVPVIHFCPINHSKTWWQKITAILLCSWFSGSEIWPRASWERLTSASWWLKSHLRHWNGRKLLRKLSWGHVPRALVLAVGWVPYFFYVFCRVEQECLRGLLQSHIWCLSWDRWNIWGWPGLAHSFSSQDFSTCQVWAAW